MSLCQHSQVSSPAEPLLQTVWKYWCKYSHRVFQCIVLCFSLLWRPGCVLPVHRGCQGPHLFLTEVNVWGVIRCLLSQRGNKLSFLMSASNLSNTRSWVWSLILGCPLHKAAWWSQGTSWPHYPLQRWHLRHLMDSYVGTPWPVCCDLIPLRDPSERTTARHALSFDMKGKWMRKFGIYLKSLVCSL